MNTSDDDFASPVVFKKSKPRGTALNTKMTAIKTNKTRKKATKKQLTLHQVLRENSQITDTNEEHLQMALALSKSASEMLETDGEKKDPAWNLNLAMNPDLKGTLLEFGFKSGRSRMAVENKLRRVVMPTKKKTSKFRFITPILLLRTEEERQTLIQSKISLILSQNTGTMQQNPNVPSPKLSSIHLNEIKCSDCCIFRLNHNLDKRPRDDFKVLELDIFDKRSRCGCLLKNWGKIASRDLSPEPQQTEELKERSVCYKSSSNSLSVQEDVECHKTIIKNKSLQMNCALSPDLFDDTFIGEKSTDVELDSVTPKIRRNLSCIFASDKSDPIEESLGINNDLKNNDDSSKYSSKNNSCDNSIYHFDGYDTDDDFPCLNTSSNENKEKDANTINVPEKYSEPQKDVRSSNENHRKYRISSSDEENQMNVDTDFLTIETMDSHASNIDGNLRINTTEINCNTPIRSSGNCNKLLDLSEKKISAECDLQDAYIVLDSDEELASISSHSPKLLDNGKETEIIAHNSNSSLSDDFDKLAEKEFREQSNSKITEDLYPNDYSLLDKFGEDNGVPEELNSSNNLLPEIDSFELSNSKSFRQVSQSKENSKLLIERKDSAENDISIIDNEPNASFRSVAQLSPILHCSNSNRVSYRDSISLNVTKHIEEILAGSYNQINSLTLSDVDSSNLNQSVSKKSSCKITKELSDIITGKNSSLERSSTDLSEEVICISDDELNYSCGNKNIENIDESMKVESAVFKKYSSFTESPSRQKTSFTRHKSESFITPKRNVVIKTKDITPMMEYDALSTPDIVKELDKFGLKPLKRKRGVNLLKYIYEATHPTVEKKEVSEETEQALKKHKSNESTKSTYKIFKSAKIFDNSWIESIPESEIIFEKRRPSKIHLCQIPLQIVWHNFLIENPQIYEKILLYEPVQVEEIHKKLKEEGFKFHLQDLITFLDRKCITIRVSQNHSNKIKS